MRERALGQLGGTLVTQFFVAASAEVRRGRIRQEDQILDCLALAEGQRATGEALAVEEVDSLIELDFGKKYGFGCS